MITFLPHFFPFPPSGHLDPAIPCLLLAHSLPLTRQGNFSLQPMEKVIENITKLNAGRWSTVPIPTDESAIQRPIPKTQDQRRGRKFAVRPCLLEVSETTPIESPQHECTNIGWTRTTGNNGWGSPWGFNSTRRSAVAKECREWELSFPGKSTPTGYPVPNGLPRKHASREHTYWTGCIYIFGNI